MAGPGNPAPAPAAPPPEDNIGYGYSHRNAWKAVAVTLATILLELALLQLFAIGATTGIYHLAPQLDVGGPRGFRDWLSILQTVSATLTLPGGAAIMLSTWLMSRWVRMAEQNAAAAQQKLSAMTAEAKKWQETAVEAQASADSARAEAASARAEAESARAENAALQSEVERRPRRRRRLHR